MAVAAALGTASIYPLQPAIADVAGTLDISVTQVGVALACGPVGYLLGLALLVPLVDRFPPKYVLAMQFCVLALALVSNAAAGTPWLLGLAVGVIGAASTVGAQLSSVAARFTPVRRRATALGIVTAGISAGIIGGRVAGGWLTEVFGWRVTLLVFALTCVAIALIALAILPAANGTVTTSLLATVRGLPGLIVGSPMLRLAAVRGALWFFAFCAVWSGLAVALAQPPFSYSAEQIGLFAVAGLLGIVATRIAGAWTDRVGARRVILVGLVVAALAAAALGSFLSSTVATLICLALFDAGLFAAQVANQSLVLAIDPAAPARFNSAYMVVYFIGGTVGTAFGAAAVGWFGWPTTAAVTAAAIALAMALTAPNRFRVP
ncbi:MFS transporter [Mycobacterium sp. CBMA247]|nr:MFS transporter [Mycolicibacterium sp. CBMA 329]MUL89657.1 MFS transporter [Mycolicibacterium sp. CBMA 331]MUL99832.1 MFS transporter [Mycolicibacterium sp. CBMA 334]MUM28763.1 MFS transporter [Mycolicibacterium sp. CBMA 295]MUM39172.1 MFS transporter [Mycolicibacterium sp. CBMA 247]MUM46258.1 MFS transporter [Mycolicibacterium sp. CBMA 294]